jgi:dipeptidyl aminopeptidase/acylaminoacyl peptidase
MDEEAESACRERNAAAPRPPLCYLCCAPLGDDAAVVVDRGFASSSVSSWVGGPEAGLTLYPMHVLAGVRVSAVTVLVLGLSAAAAAGGGTRLGNGEIAYVRAPAQAPTGRVVSRIFVVGGDGRSHRLPLPVANAAAPAWSPDGTRIAFRGIVNGADEIYVARADGSRVHRLTRDRRHEFAPAWSPDGRRIVFVRSAVRVGNRSSIVVMNSDGGGVRQLTTGSIDLQPSWSSDGRWIAFLRVDPKSYVSGIWLSRPDGSGAHRILTSLKNVSEPVWSPVGRRLLLSSGRSLVVVNADGSGRRTIAKLAAGARGEREDPSPSWSPDGTQVVFGQLRTRTEGHSDIWVVSTDGTALTRITHSPGLDTDPSWKPLTSR